MKKTFYGWWITLAAFLTFGISVGIPYYSGPFFYDYYEKAPALGGFGWTRPEITLGFPLAALFTLWVGPLLVHRFSPRKMILVGTAFTCVAFLGFGRMTGTLPVYYGMWFLYTVGYIFSGPIPHQVLISQWFKKNRGTAMGVAYLGVGLFGAISAKGIAKPLTEQYGFQGALQIMGLIMFAAWPIVLFVMKDRPADVGQNPDGAATTAGHENLAPKPFSELLGKRAFWLLVVGSFCSIGSIGSINQHMKLIFKDRGFTDQNLLNTAFADALFAIMVSSIAGRLIMGWLADRFPKKYVMTATYLLVAVTIPLLLTVHPPETPYLFAILFGFGMGADYMLIPLMAADQFGVATLARAMAIILPTDTIGQTWFPYFVSLLRQSFGDYTMPLATIFGLALVGAIAVGMMPAHADENETLPLQESERAAARR